MPWGSHSREGAVPAEEAVDNGLVDVGQLFQVGHGDMLVDLVHGLADDAELHHRTMVLDETGIGRSARGAEFRPVSRHALDGAGDQIAQAPWKSQEGLAADSEAEIVRTPDAVAGPAYPVLQRIGRMLVVEADIEAGGPLGRDHVVGRIADIDRRDRQGGGLEVLVAPVQRLGRQGGQHPDQAGQGLSARCG